MYGRTQTPCHNSRSQPLQLWGGIECTVNRVGERYRDQTLLSGHQGRPEDLELFANLGIRALRYPVLWERTAPTSSCVPDWSWPDARLSRLRSLAIRPIVGLVHHGSGPSYTNLLADGFAAELGRFAGLVAARYPWIDDWTPINEPLTTARFSALYGHWYPHHSDERSFWLALINQVDAIRMAMGAIRRVNPAARLIQTDDLGRTYATAQMSKQADYDNLRRWAGWDLLFGRVDRSHPLAGIFERMGLGDRIRRIADDPCPPDVIGLNHYLTSDRFLDHRIGRYPAQLHGANGQIAYADTEAVRVLDPVPDGLATALREAWTRYGTTMALTEVHNGCTVEEQMRWAAEAWDAAETARRGGMDVCAVTAWSLLGSHGWNTLLTSDGFYEPGVFDVSSGRPVATALATLWRALPLRCERHPVAKEKGWWRRAERVLYPLLPLERIFEADVPPLDEIILIIRDATGAHGPAFADACRARGIRHSLERAPNKEGDRSGGSPEKRMAAKPWGVLEILSDDVQGNDPNADGAWLVTISRSVLGDRFCVEVPAKVPTTSLAQEGSGLISATIGRVIDLIIECRVGRWIVTAGQIVLEN